MNEMIFKGITDLETVRKLSSLENNRLFIDTAWGMKQLYSMNRDYEVKFGNPSNKGEYKSEFELNYGLCHAGTSVYIGLKDMDIQEDYQYHLIKDCMLGLYMILEGEEDVDWDATYDSRLMVTKKRFEYLYSFTNLGEAKIIKNRYQREYDKPFERKVK